MFIFIRGCFLLGTSRLQRGQGPRELPGPRASRPLSSDSSAVSSARPAKRHRRAVPLFGKGLKHADGDFFSFFKLSFITSWKPVEYRKKKEICPYEMNFHMKTVVTAFSHLMHLFPWVDLVRIAFWFTDRIMHNVHIQSMLAGFADDSCFPVRSMCS